VIITFISVFGADATESFAKQEKLTDVTDVTCFR